MTNKFKVGDKVVAINKTSGLYCFEEFKGQCKDEFLVVTDVENGKIFANAKNCTHWEFKTGDLIPYVESSNFKIGF